ncbi:unnamed protein product [Mytilus coruscus]|uniref:BIRC7_8 n=1 Tax=Mytilus coruscus TaxID=42192 RepID=A0A6J8AV66_MYTCO|nr:unnamed protein product [Mytilus coruscus]
MAGKMFQPNFPSQTIEPVLVYQSNSLGNQQSFLNWRGGKTSLLIEAGFKYTGMGDILMCPICNVTTRFNEWCKTKEPHEKHIELTPTCEYAKEVNDMKKCRKVVLSNKNTTYASSSTPSLKELTVSEWQSNFGVSGELAEKLKSYGFLYDRGMDAVRCGSCRVAIEKEELKSNLTVMHARFSPDCSLIMKHVAKNRLMFLQNSWKQIKEDKLPFAIVVVYPCCLGSYSWVHGKRMPFLEVSASTWKSEKDPNTYSILQRHWKVEIRELKEYLNQVNAYLRRTKKSSNPR